MSTDYTSLVLESERIRLVPTTLADAEVIFQEFTEEVTRYMYPKPTGNIQNTIDFITDSRVKMEQGINLQITIFDAKTGEFLGGGGLHRLDTMTPEFGIWIKLSAHGHGYGREAMWLIKKWAEDNLKYDYLLYPVVDVNFPSRKIAESLGGVYVREYDDVDVRWGPMHLVEYHIYPV